MKKLVSLLLAVMMLISMAGILTASADGVTNLQFYFAIVAGGALQQTMEVMGLTRAQKEDLFYNNAMEMISGRK